MLVTNDEVYLAGLAKTLADFFSILLRDSPSPH